MKYLKLSYLLILFFTGEKLFSKENTFQVGIGYSLISAPTDLGKFWQPGLTINGGVSFNIGNIKYLTILGYQFAYFDDQKWLTSNKNTSAFKTISNNSGITYYYFGENIVWSPQSKSPFAIYVESGFGYFFSSHGETLAKDDSLNLLIKPGATKPAIQFNAGGGLRININKTGVVAIIGMRQVFALTKPQTTRFMPIFVSIEF
ncbi:MAG: hypothetical protein O3A55_03280 [Bacteroidetes bacterium]|nr:hypothetical protein [Bacteroidota bacterium]